MKIKLLLCIALICLGSLSVSAQKLTLGIESGVNYSNLRKSFDYSRFASIPGPLSGFVVKYDLMPWLTLQSGANHTAYYFNEYNNNINYENFGTYFPSLTDNVMQPNYYVENPNFSFLRIPLLVKFRTPGRVNFEIGGGAYYAFLTNDEFRGKERELYTKEYRDEYFPKMNDWGLILASAVNYNINYQWSAFVSGQITYGHETYIENVKGKMGSSEITFGIGYKPFVAKHHVSETDTSLQKISVLPHAGVNISKVKSSIDKSSYKASVGFSSGVSIKYQMAKNVAVVSGAWYDRKGYNLENNGYQPAVFILNDENQYRSLISDVQLDYLSIPLLMDFSFGKKIINHIQLGAYYSLLQNAFAEGVRTNKSDYGQGYQISKQYFNESLDLCFNNSDIGFMAEYKIDVPVFEWANAFISINQSIGLKNILNNSDDAKSKYSFAYYQKIQNRSTGILFGLTIPINKNLKR
jgi:hypothetical protein